MSAIEPSALPSSPLPRVLTAGLMALLSLAPIHASAAPPEEEQTDGQAAEAMFRRGQAKYETADYTGAIELWTEAYALVDATPENATIKALIIYNLAQAHESAFELDGDLIHLKQSLRLMESFEASLELLYEDQAAVDEESAKVQTRIAELEAQIAAAETPDPEPEHEPEPETEPEQTGPVDDPKPSGTPFIAAGGVLAGLGVAGGVVAILGGVRASNANDLDDLDPNDLQGREDQFNSGLTGDTMLIWGSVAAGVLIPTGVALLVVGVIRNKKAKGQTAVVPTFGPHGAGLSFSGRF